MNARQTHHLLPAVILVMVIALCLSVSAATAQTGSGSPAPAPAAPGRPVATPPTTVVGTSAVDLNNPLSILDYATRALPGGGNNQPAPGNGMEPPVAMANNVPAGTSIGLPEVPANAPATGKPGGLSASLSILVLLTILTIAPALLILCTSFTRIVIVLSLLRQAIGTQALPPSQVIVGLSLFMTLLVMSPTFDRINKEAIGPLQRNEIDQLKAWEAAKQPLRDFMFAQIEYAGNEDDLYMMLSYRGVDVSEPSRIKRQDVDMLALIPAFILSELKVAFLMGFRLYLPFLVIDMVISSVLISMGMLMLPPVLISLPFKLLMFVLVDGWHLVVGNILNSFAPVSPLVT